MARWLQQTVQGMITPELKDVSLPVTEARFHKSGDLRYFWTEQIAAHDTEIALTWHDFGQSILIHSHPNSRSNPRPYGVCSVLIPALASRLTVNGEQAKGRTWPREREGRPFGTSALAFSESWTEPQ
jgi:hypothetical protein